MNSFIPILNKKIVKLKKILSIVKNIWFFYIGEGKDTYCPFLWDSAIITKNGDIFSCCAMGPSKWGNIYKGKLQKFYTKSWVLRIAKWLSLHGSLHCINTCFLKNFQVSSKNQHSIPRRNIPEKIMIELGTFCNLRCKMCSQNHLSKDIINIKTLKENVEWENIKEVTFTGGEVLAIPQFKEIFREVTKKNKKICIFTNGVLLDKEWNRVMAENGDKIYISVNAATRNVYKDVCGQDVFCKVLNNIENLVKLRNKFKSKLRIEFHFTMIPENIFEIPEAIILANNIGCDIFSFCSDTKGNLFLSKNKKVKEKIKNEINSAISEHDLKINICKEALKGLDLID